MKKGNLNKKVKFLCNLTAFVLELIAIFLVSKGAQLEIIYSEEIYLWMITMGGLLLGIAAFFQQKLPWAYTRFGKEKKKEEVQKEDGGVPNKMSSRGLQKK